jgi:hypothetical protein
LEGAFIEEIPTGRGCTQMGYNPEDAPFVSKAAK